MVVVEGELRQHLAEMPFVKHDHVIETLAANRSDEPFGDRVRLGRWYRSPNTYDSDSSHPRVEVAAVVHGRALTPAEVASRYGRPIRRVSSDFAVEPGFKSLYEAPAEQLLAEVRQYELTYGRADAAQLQLRYRVNGHTVQEWRWPQH
jgi:hypothetical protein